MTKRTPISVPENRRPRRSWAWFAAALLLVIAALLLWPRKQVAEAVLKDATEPVSHAPSMVGRPSAASPPVAPEPESEPPPVIDEISVEKPEVCEGEDNLVTVRAHTDNRTDEYLHYVIDGQLGSSVPVRLSRDGDEIAGQHFIRVFGRQNAATTVPLPQYRVNHCQLPYAAQVNAGLRANSWSAYDFNVRILPSNIFRVPKPVMPKTPFRAVSYRWSFGDGEHTTTTLPTITHDYEGRRQDTKFSDMLVTVEITGQDGSTLKARTSLSLLNPAFEALAEKGIVQILTSLHPRFPVLDEQKRVVQHVKLWHLSKEPVTVGTVARVKYFAGASGESPPEALDPGAVLGVDSIPPGPEGIEATVVLDTVAEPEVFSVTYELSGKSSDGHKVMGTFSVMRPPPVPGRDNSKPVTDSVLLAKILAARQMLGKDVVNDDEIAQLDREGRFASLAPAPEPSSLLLPGAPPGPSPEHGVSPPTSESTPPKRQ